MVLEHDIDHVVLRHVVLERGEDDPPENLKKKEKEAHDRMTMLAAREVLERESALSIMQTESIHPRPPMHLDHVYTSSHRSTNGAPTSMPTNAPRPCLHKLSSMHEWGAHTNAHQCTSTVFSQAHLNTNGAPTNAQRRTSSM